MEYYEIEFSNPSVVYEADNIWLCIKGVREPSIAEANIFCAEEVKQFGMSVIGVYPIDERTARGCYDFTNEADWPIFGA